MKRGLFTFCALILLAAPQSVWGGGTVYVPLALDKDVEGNHFRTEIRVYNDAAVARKFHYLFIESGADGTQFDRETEPIEVTVAARRTMYYDNLVPPGKLGVLEINADTELFVTGRLLGTPAAGGETFGVELPVVTSLNAVTAGITSALPGLKRSEGELLSDYYLLNLSPQNAECAIEVLRQGGTKVLDEVFLFGPLSLFRFGDALGLVDVTNASDLSIATTCDQLSHPFATLHELSTAEMLYVPPAGGGTSTLLRPDDQPICPAGSVCFETAGVFHTPTRSRPVHRLTTTPPVGEYRRIRAQLTVVHGGWNAADPSARHNIFWFARDGNGDLFGYVLALGPNKNLFRLVHGVGLLHDDKMRAEKKLVMQAGATYHLDYTYNAAQRFLVLIVTNDEGKELVRLEDTTNVSTISIRSGQQMFWDFGFTGESPKEPATIGWIYKDLFVEFTP